MGIKWHQSLSIGVKPIDDQHKELVSRFDQFLKACDNNLGFTELKRLLNFLDEYSVTHFKDEEELQRKLNYPDYDAHRKEHEALSIRIKNLQKEVDREGVATPHIIETNNFLIQWLINHISLSDNAIGKFMKSQSS